MDDMLYAEQQRLLNHVSVDVKDQFLKHCPGFKEQHKVGFDMVAGFDEHIMALKEMVGLPLMYPDLFQQFGVTPPKGVLFHGPPGTGKTLMARALAQSCSMNGKPVAFFVRKGADVLNKWVGESEKQLRLLFEQAKGI
jgi:ATP-dependent 26S proteasome regulatory subunit